MAIEDEQTQRLAGTLDMVAGRLEEARPFAKHRHRQVALDVAARLAKSPGGIEVLAGQAARLDAAGLFAGSDWDAPETLLPQLVGQTLDSGDPALVAVETVSLLRMLAIANGEAAHDNLHSEAARHFLTQTLALNLRHVFGIVGEAERGSAGSGLRRALFGLIAERIGFGDVLSVLVDEIWRILDQRPVQVGSIKEMITQISLAMTREDVAVVQERLGADRLVNALFGPTSACMDDPGIAAYLERLDQMDETSLQREATGFSRAMHDTGLVSDYHAGFVRWAVERSASESDLLPDALGLGPTGIDSLRRWRGLVRDLILRAVSAYTPQAVYGLAMLLDRGTLYAPPAVPALQRQLQTVLHPDVAARLALGFGDGVPPDAHLLAGTLCILGQPLGVGQGANPTCQSARAISMWASNDPDYVLYLIRQASEHDHVVMAFEGESIDSAALPAGLAAGAPIDADPVSVVLVPHLDRIYAEMGRRCIGREGDPHRWVNPEFHGWWVSRDCAVAVDVATGHLSDYDAFLTRFCKTYHPEFNGGHPLIHPQPAGIAVTDSSARFVGWHAIAILRVSEDQTGTMRVYFYNPNNDSGQDWGDGVVVSTTGCGERPGEASLPFVEFASRLYLFHDDPIEAAGVSAEVPDRLLVEITRRATESWAATRLAVTDTLAGSA